MVKAYHFILLVFFFPLYFLQLYVPCICVRADMFLFVC
uniref:Uncharacterized protein n=1 Tax=Rhizophora mucronata TaxID=61149 RepID=A0A2P2R0U9_RHIMU